jgi:hypothetical protein
MNQLTDFEKEIYNCYLKNFRKGEPYRPRKDFSNVNPNIVVSLKKISYFLNKYTHINLDEYFEAPNFLFKDEKYPTLASFVGRTALKNYAMYQKQKQDRNPENQFDDIKKGFRFIAMYCIESNINLSEYLTHKTGYMYSWLNHYREHRINPYCLFGLGNVFFTLDQIPKDELCLFAQNLYENITSYHNRYTKSLTTKNYCNEIIKRITKFITDEKNKKNS